MAYWLRNVLLPMQKPSILYSVWELRCMFGGFLARGINKNQNPGDHNLKNNLRENSQFHKLPKNPRKLRSSGGQPDGQKDDSFSLRRENSGDKNVSAGGQWQ